MQKKFFSNLILIVILNLLVKPLAIFGIDATIQNRVGVEAYGLYFSLLNLSFLFNIAMDLGINNYTTRHMAQYPHIVSRYLGKIFSFRLLLFVLYAIITLSLGWIIGYHGKAFYFLLLLIFNQLLVTFIAYFRSHFGGLHLFPIDALISVFDRILLIVIAGYLLFFSAAGQRFQIEWFIWIQTICYLATFVLALVLLTKHIGWPKFKFNWVFSLAILKQSYPYALLILLMMLYTRTDSIMLDRLHPNGSQEAGVYAQGFRLLDAFFMFGMIFANLLFPMFSRMIKTDKQAIPTLLHSARNILVGGSILIAFLSFFQAETFLKLIYSNAIAESIPSFQWLMWSFIGMCISLIYGTLLTANGDLRTLNIISILGILINIGLNLYLIPKYGASGAAFATLCTQGLTAVAQLYVAHKNFHIAFPWLQFLRYAGFIAYLILLSFVDPNYQLISLLIGGTFGLFLFRLIDLRSISKAFQKNL